MTTIYSASWILPVSAPPIENGAVAIDGARIVGVGVRAGLLSRFPQARVQEFPQAMILPGLINTHTHLELTAMRGYLENEEADFYSGAKKVPTPRLEIMTPDDIYVSAAWGACEAARAGITCVGDASDSGGLAFRALQAVGLRGIVFQESFGPDPQLAQENFEKLKDKVTELRDVESATVRAGVSPHAPYTVCAAQLELIADYALAANLSLMMHAAESRAEDLLLREGTGLFAEGLARRSIEWHAPGKSTTQFLQQTGILGTKPLLAHCIRVDERDIETLAETESKVAHCPKSNAKLMHGRAPLAKFLYKGIAVGLGSDSVASNNTCDILEEARFAVLLSRTAMAEMDKDRIVSAQDVFSTATQGGAVCLGLGGEVGELSEGSQADLTILSMRGVQQVPNYDPVVTAIFASSGRDVLLTMVAGKEVYRDGRMINVDEERLRARMGEIARKLSEWS